MDRRTFLTTTGTAAGCLAAGVVEAGVDNEAERRLRRCRVKLTGTTPYLAWVGRRHPGMSRDLWLRPHLLEDGTLAFQSRDLYESFADAVRRIIARIHINPEHFGQSSREYRGMPITAPDFFIYCQPNRSDYSLGVKPANLPTITYPNAEASFLFVQNWEVTLELNVLDREPICRLLPGVIHYAGEFSGLGAMTPRDAVVPDIYGRFDTKFSWLQGT